MPQTLAARYLAQLRSCPTGWCGVCHADPLLCLRQSEADAIECLACGARADLRADGGDYIAARWSGGDRKRGPA